MKRVILGVIFLLAAFAAGRAQEAAVLKGTVVERKASGAFSPVAGASVYWLGTRTGTTSDTVGAFNIPRVPTTNLLVVQCIGYGPDTVGVGSGPAVRVVLVEEVKQVADVEVVGERSSTVIDYLSPQSSQIMTGKELVKAACCNLSESFETNPSIDVSFTDAITGTRQIEMLGLAGTYSQITTENLPAIRGLTSTAGLTYIPGTWVESIQVSKGVGSVANGYESMTGQINVELRKPNNADERTLFVNVYGSQDLRMESNIHLRQELGDNLSTLSLIHVSGQRRSVDGNGDRFLDMPLFRTVNALQRVGFSPVENWESQVTAQYVSEEREGGTVRGQALRRNELPLNPSEYSFSNRARQFRLSGKTGHIFSEEKGRSMGVQWSYANYHNDAFFGARDYSGREQTGYLNVLYDGKLGESHDRLRAGMSFLFDDFDEQFEDARYRRTERVPGAFVEYTGEFTDELSVVAGLRVDRHNLFGTFLTPRLHLRYAPEEDWVIRAVAGRGRRTPNILAENLSTLASARRIQPGLFTIGYPFEQEIAWNFGLNVTHYFLWEYREATITVDYYHTSFDRQVVVDLDRSPREVSFYGLGGPSFSNSVQAELTIQPLERFEVRTAYRFLDVRQTLHSGLRERPFVSRHRAFVNLAYSTAEEMDEDPRMAYDLTVQWFGPKRLPDTEANPEEFRAARYSPDFALVNAQVTRTFAPGLDIYLGVENLLNFRQPHPILDAENPASPYFDASIIWGPVAGRMVYVGARWGL